MIQINKQGNAIVIEFTDNDKYLFDGTIEVAPNELMVVIDESDMATFKRTSNGDVLFSQLIDQIQIAGSTVTKDTIIEQFAIIGFQSGGGGGTGAVSSVNGQTGDVVLTAGSLNAYTKQEVNTLLASKADTSALENYATFEELQEEQTERQKQDSALGGMIAAETTAREQAISKKQDTLVSGQNIKTVNGQTLLGEGNIQIEGGAEWDYTQLTAYNENSPSYGDNFFNTAKVGDIIHSTTISNQVFDVVIASIYNLSSSSKLYSLFTANLSIGVKASILTVDFSSKIAVINSEFKLDQIPIDNSLSSVSTNPVQNKVITEALSEKMIRVTANLSTYTQLLNPATWLINIPGYSSNSTGMVINNPTVTSANAIVKGEDGYHLIELTQSAGTNWLYTVTSDLLLSTTVDSELSTTSENPVQNKVITNAINGKQDAGDYALKSELPDTSGLATKEELASKLDIATYNSEKEDFETKENASATYQVKGDYATTAQLNSKQDTLVSGTNIKTINGDSILGEGNIDISGGSNLTVQEGSTGTASNYIYSSGVDTDGKGVIVDIVANATGTITEDSVRLQVAYWGTTNTYRSKPSQIIPAATTTKAGVMSAADKTKLDNINTDNFATKSELSNKQDTLVSGANIKTVNGESILGSGDIVIQGGGTVDTVMSDSSENAVQNKVIKAYIDGLVGEISARLDQINGEVIE